MTPSSLGSLVFDELGHLNHMWRPSNSNDWSQISVELLEPKWTISVKSSQRWLCRCDSAGLRVTATTRTQKKRSSNRAWSATATTVISIKLSFRKAVDLTDIASHEKALLCLPRQWNRWRYHDWNLELCHISFWAADQTVRDWTPQGRSYLVKSCSRACSAWYGRVCS